MLNRFVSSTTDGMLNDVMRAFNVPKMYIEQGSRNGPVRRLPGISVLEYTTPQNCLCNCRIRDANPFFHVFEAAWMLAGRKDTAALCSILPGMKLFSDNGEDFNAAYGYRLRCAFGIDQLREIGDILRNNHESRQCVAQIWDTDDLNKLTKDKACNLCLVFQVTNGKLDLTIYNRSNDAVLGAVAGANSVHMFFFLKFVSEIAGLPVGTMYQVTCNLHMYTEHPKTKLLLEAYGPNGILADWCPLDAESDIELWLNDRPCTWTNFLRSFMYDHVAEPKTLLTEEYTYGAKFIDEVLAPLRDSYVLHRKGDSPGARLLAQTIASEYIREACMSWLERRKK